MSELPPAAARPGATRAGTWFARVPTGAALVFIGLVALAAYVNSFGGKAVFDDAVNIRDNRSIRNLRQMGNVLWPPAEIGTAGRPLLNLSLAVNYAWDGLNVRGYHLINLAIHIAAASVLFILIRRTLALTRDFAAESASNGAMALIIAVLWAVHPLQTASVTYLSQRAESLMGLCYLLTLYGFVRGATAPVPRRWYALAVLSCLAGMATKEVMVTAPLLVLLYDRTFIAGSFTAAWRTRRSLYAALAATWVALAWFMQASDVRVRLGYEAHFTPWSYALNETAVIIRYLALALWPHPLVFDYGPEPLARTWSEAWPAAGLLAGLLGLTLLALARGRKFGLFGAAFFIFLLPHSSFIPVQHQPMAENRMYLPLAAVIVIVVIGLAHLLRPRVAVTLLAVAALVGLTYTRNKAYASEVALWQDTVVKRPDNARAQVHYGAELAKLGRQAEARRCFEQVIRINPGYAPAYNGLAIELGKNPQTKADAVNLYETALRLRPNYPEAHANLASELAKVPGRLPDAIAHYEAALRQRPYLGPAHTGLGEALVRAGRENEAMAHYREALRIDPADAEAHNNLGNLLATKPERRSEAIAHQEEALRHRPDYAEAHANLATLLAADATRASDAAAHYERALQIKPDLVEAHYGFGNLLAGFPERRPEAIGRYRDALRLRPDFVEAHANLAALLARDPGQLPLAIVHYRTAVELRPEYHLLHYRLALALLQNGDKPGAADELTATLRLKPDFVEARERLARLNQRVE